MGILRIRGTLDLNQFWPKGVVGNKKGADADTIRVLVDKKAGVLFNGKPTSSLASAYVLDRNKKNLVINSNREATIRLQGVDAPELHYPTTISSKIAKAANGDFRQSGGETATKALASFLKKKFGNGPPACEVVSQNVSRPKDVCDSHGRIVGNVLVGGVDINLWLLDEGWALPTFYNSMLPDEIAEAAERAKNARQAGKGVWPTYQAVAFFDPAMQYRRKDAGGSDKGKVLLPKLFRRSAASFVTHGALQNLMVDIRKSATDRYVSTRDFLKGTQTFKQWGDATGGAIQQMPSGKVKLTVAPWEFVLKEEPSILLRDVNGKPEEVTKF